MTTRLKKTSNILCRDPDSNRDGRKCPGDFENSAGVASLQTGGSVAFPGVPAEQALPLDCPPLACDEGLARRFWAKVEKTRTCWLWTAALNSKGYGTIGHGGRRPSGSWRTILAHRASYLMHVGPIQDGQDVLHRCDNPQCVRPAHLMLGDDAENTRDKMRKNRQARGEMLPQSRLTDAAVREIRQQGARLDVHRAAARYGVTPSTISSVLRAATWRHVQTDRRAK